MIPLSLAHSRRSCRLAKRALNTERSRASRERKLRQEKEVESRFELLEMHHRELEAQLTSLTCVRARILVELKEQLCFPDFTDCIDFGVACEPV